MHEAWEEWSWSSFQLAKTQAQESPALGWREKKERFGGGIGVLYLEDRAIAGAESGLSHEEQFH